MLALLWVMLGVRVSLPYAAADRGKPLSEPGVYGIFAGFSLDEEWAKEDQAMRISRLTVLRGVAEQHREKVAIDLYRMRRLSDHADPVFRTHVAELRDVQKFLVDLQNSLFGKHRKTAGGMNGLTKRSTTHRDFLIK